MKRSWEIGAAILLLSAPISEGAEPPPVSMLALPRMELRKATEPAGAGREVQKETASSTEKEELTISMGSADRNSDDSETSVQVFETMNGAALLSQVEMRDEPSGAIGWVETQVWDPVFAPEVVKFGKVKMSGGIVAAIKRKNPFCLLNPLAFVASW